MVALLGYDHLETARECGIARSQEIHARRNPGHGEHHDLTPTMNDER